MPLRDHFRPPLSLRRHWHAFHNAWATFLASDLNRRLPEGYFAEANVQFGIEIDVATFEKSAGGENPDLPGGSSTAGWTAPAPTLTVPFPVGTDTVEVAVYGNEGGPSLAGAVELVSPANKDRPEHREAFLSKCSAYLQQGIGLIIVDVVTQRKGNLPSELLRRFAGCEPSWDADLYTAAYHPVERSGQTSLDIWQEALAVGRRLPTMPLWLRGAPYVPVDLEATYERTCSEYRLPATGF